MKKGIFNIFTRKMFHLKALLDKAHRRRYNLFKTPKGGK